MFDKIQLISCYALPYPLPPPQKKIKTKPNKMTYAYYIQR